MKQIRLSALRDAIKGITFMIQDVVIVLVAHEDKDGESNIGNWLAAMLRDFVNNAVKETVKSAEFEFHVL